MGILFSCFYLSNIYGFTITRFVGGGGTDGSWRKEDVVALYIKSNKLYKEGISKMYFN